MPYPDSHPAADELTEDLARIAPALLREVPLDRFAVLLDRTDIYAGYSSFDPAVTAEVERTLHLGGEQGRALFLKLVLLHLIGRFDERLGSAPLVLPAGCIAEYRDIFDRIRAEMSTREPGFYDLENDLFLRDLAYCRLKLIPVRPLVTQIAGVPRILLVRGGPRQLIAGLRVLGLPFRPYRPYLEVHLNPRRLREFHATAWEESYRKIARILLRNPSLRGMTQCSWFRDPAAAEFSPRLRFVNEPVARYGAKVFRSGSSEEIVRQALAKSASRRRAYHAGQYLPGAYSLVWGREKILEWYSDCSETDDGPTPPVVRRY